MLASAGQTVPPPPLDGPPQRRGRPTGSMEDSPAPLIAPLERVIPDEGCSRGQHGSRHCERVPRPAHRNPEARAFPGARSVPQSGGWLACRPSGMAVRWGVRSIRREGFGSPRPCRRHLGEARAGRSRALLWVRRPRERGRYCCTPGERLTSDHRPGRRRFGMTRHGAMRRCRGHGDARLADHPAAPVF